jgi:hypothetical protein
MKFGEWYNVPNNKFGITKIIPNLNFTLFGRMKNLLFRGDIVYITYKLSNGEIRKYRINILNSANGIWVNPLLVDFNFKGIEVESIMFETNGKYYIKLNLTTKNNL